MVKWNEIKKAYKKIEHILKTRFINHYTISVTLWDDNDFQIEGRCGFMCSKLGELQNKIYYHHSTKKITDIVAKITSQEKFKSFHNKQFNNFKDVKGVENWRK